MSETAQQIEFGSWNPGIRSQLPSPLLPLSTIFRPENASVSADEARDLSGFTGLPLYDFATFRPERLVVHELLIRVTADFSIPDGLKYEDLGLNFREIATAILSGHIAPHMAEICDAFEAYRDDVTRFIETELSASVYSSPKAAGENAAKNPFSRLFDGWRKKTARDAADDATGDRERDALSDWERKAAATDDAMHRAAYEALIRMVTAISGRHGRLRGDRALLTSIATNMVCNSIGSDLIGGIIAPYIRDAAAWENYRRLPPQPHPVVMNIKGASASGKSTMRPLQRKLAEELGIDWADFALISPDIWRKYLLDYDSLGADYKYAGTLTGHELEIIDQKLDRYMAEKAETGAMSHLLIDRFRFDSFAPEPDAEEGSNLLTRFGHEIYMFFMITPPEATVERAWKRGLKFGRYKAVDDLLDHNVEAFTGMPRLFFTWALKTDRTVYYEFLDNSVAEGEQPRTVAFGCNEEMTIVDFKCLIDIDRYRKINIDARCPEDVYPETTSFKAEANTEFLLQCAEKIGTIDFADPNSGGIYARMENGRLVWADPAGFKRALEAPETRAGLLAMDPDAVSRADSSGELPTPTRSAAVHTLGQWGQRPSTRDPVRSW